MAGPRAVLAEALTTALPKRYVVLDHETSLGQIGKPTVILKQQRIRALPAAPQARLQVDYIVTVATPSSDERQRELDLDEEVLELLLVLDERNDLVWTEATKVAVDDYLGYDITVSIDILKG